MWFQTAKTMSIPETAWGIKYLITGLPNPNIGVSSIVRIDGYGANNKVPYGFIVDGSKRLTLARMDGTTTPDIVSPSNYYGFHLVWLV